MENRNVAVFIPARMGSKRFPGKVLHPVNGIPLLRRTYQKASRSGYLTCVITPDVEIVEFCDDDDIPVIQTSDAPNNGTERCAEAISNEMFTDFKDGDIIINVQGDLADFDPEGIKMLVGILSDYDYLFASLFTRLEERDVNNPNKVKVAIVDDCTTNRSMAYDFDREWIRHHLNYLHVGIYGYTKAGLELYNSLKPVKKEKTRKLEQMRMINNWLRVAMCFCSECFSIDCQQDVADFCNEYMRG